MLYSSTSQFTEPVAASPCRGDRPGGAGATVPSGPGVSDFIADPAARALLAESKQSSARLNAGLERLERIARQVGSSRTDLAVARVLDNMLTAQRLDYEQFNQMTGSWETLGERFGT